MRHPILAMLLCTMLCAILPATPASATTLHVPSQYPLIADAMVFASRGDTVLVACGTYNEGNILMKSGVTLIGESGEVGCVTISGQNTSRVIECVDCDDTTAIIGIRFVNGFVTSPGGYGGGISCSNSSPRLENLEFIFCQVRAADGQGGGGLGCLNSSPTLTNVEFHGCVLQDATAHGGGAMVTLGASYPTLSNVTFDMNWVTDSWGGALSIEGYSGGVIRMDDVTFTDNSSSTVGGGGAIHVSGTPTTIDGALFHDNWASHGGAIHYDTCRPCTLRNVTFTENTAAYGQGGGLLCEVSPAGTLVLTDAVFLDNTAATTGGGMACNATNTPTITRATFARNSAVDGGGLSIAGSSVVKVTSSTFYDNAASNTGGGIYLDGSSSLDVDTSILAYSADGEAIAPWGDIPPAVSCTDIYGNAGGDWIGMLAPLLGTAGNISEPPLFCEMLNIILTLHEDSPCLPGASACGVLMGAHGLGCAPSTTVPDDMPVLVVHNSAPNPFRRSTSLSYELPVAERVDVRVFDVSGRLVRTLVDSERQTAGLRSLSWNGRDDSGRSVASGVYFFRVNIGGESMERRSVLIR